MSAPRFWVVRVPKGEEYIKAARKKRLVAVGFRVPRSLANVKTREEIRSHYFETHPEATEQRAVMASGQLYRVAHVIAEGDWILTPDRSNRTVLYGQAKGGYTYHANVLGDTLSHTRKVEWQGEFSRDEMSEALRMSMGGGTTVLNLDKHGREILKLMKQPVKSKKSEDVDDPWVSFYEDTKEKAGELTNDLIARIDPYVFQDLVAGLLQAMGYRTRVTEKGPDQGVDIIAHPDVLGFDTPRIKVQVKHRQAATGAPEVRNLIGTLAEGEMALFVSTSGFSKQALQEAKSKTRLTLIDGDEFVDLLTEHYNQLDSDYRALVPLRKVWVPVSSK